MLLCWEDFVSSFFLGFFGSAYFIYVFLLSVVEFEKAEDADRAIKELEGTIHEGRTIHVRQVSICNLKDYRDRFFLVTKILLVYPVRRFNLCPQARDTLFFFFCSFIRTKTEIWQKP